MKILLATITVWVTLVHGLRNITIDDTDSIIKYTGTWDPDTNHYSDLDYGGAHTISEDAKASASFTFTGVAIYYMSPLWPYAVNTQLALDGGTPVVVDLMDHSVASTGGGEETVQSAVVYSWTGLSNTQHTLVATMAPGGSYIIMDGLIYTIVDATSATTSGTPISSAPSTTSSASTSTTPVAATSGHSSSNGVAIGLGVGMGLLALIAAGILIYLLSSRRRKRLVNDPTEVPTNVPVIVSPYYDRPFSGGTVQSWAPYNPSDTHSRPTSAEQGAGSFRQSKDSSVEVTSMPTLASVIASSPSPATAEFDPRTLSGGAYSPPVTRTPFQDSRLGSPPPPAYSMGHGAGP